MLSKIELNRENAGMVVGWLRQRGIKAFMRGGPKGGSKDATVIIDQPDDFGNDRTVAEPGDVLYLVNGRVVF